MPQGIEKMRVLVWNCSLKTHVAEAGVTGQNQVTRKGGRRDTKEAKGLVPNF